MADNQSLTRPDIIRIVGDAITEIDVLRADYDRGTPIRRDLDNMRDDLDAAQRKLVRSVIRDNTNEFEQCAMSLKNINDELRETIESVDSTAQTLQTLVKFVAAIQSVVTLAA